MTEKSKVYAPVVRKRGFTWLILNVWHHSFFPAPSCLLFENELQILPVSKFTSTPLNSHHVPKKLETACWLNRIDILYWHDCIGRKVDFIEINTSILGD